MEEAAAGYAAAASTVALELIHGAADSTAGRTGRILVTHNVSSLARHVPCHIRRLGADLRVVGQLSCCIPGKLSQEKRHGHSLAIQSRGHHIQIGG
jgi:hypothetical protein